MPKWPHPWIPVFTGMTEEVTGMTEEVTGMTEEVAGMTRGRCSTLRQAQGERGLEGDVAVLLGR